MAKATVGFSCDTDSDADILSWLDKQENKSAAIRAAIRGNWLQESVTLGDVLNEIGGLKRMLRAGVTVNGNEVEEKRELDPDQRKAQSLLDSLGLL